ncbi:MAG: GNAT family N-acetyltransferase [Caldilineales bacterium]|nr:GNAT family N-acetyltransferase [Caldilineales bacterium]
MPVRIRPAADFDIVALVQTLNASYIDYPVDIHFDVHQYRQFLRTHDVDMALSVVAELDGKLAGLAQLARRDDRGWVAGLGVKPAARRHGIARGLMETLTANAAAAGISQLQLEVLHQNRAAQQLYRQLGWQHQRDLWGWRRPAGNGSDVVPRFSLVQMDPAELASRYFDWHTQPPCWQRQQETVKAMLDLGLLGWGVEDGGELIAYALGFPPQLDSMNLVDLAVNPHALPSDSGRMLLEALHFKYPTASVYLRNEPERSPLTSALEATGYAVIYRQHELTLTLNAKA